MWVAGGIDCASYVCLHSFCSGGQKTKKKIDFGCSLTFWVSWVPPDQGMIKCNFDARFLHSLSRGSGGAVFRDFWGTILHAVVFRLFYASSTLMAETIACHCAILWASHFRYDCVCFESDAKGVVDAVKDVSVCPTEITSFRFDIQMELHLFFVASLRHVRRSDNRVAHAFAMLSADRELDQCCLLIESWILSRLRLLIVLE
ncbi:uncharacterized protein LOC132282034 [Cornus florida]|uniref:uncharacterized protein LOC132282034 n=1 Tax=Cornus florida TaxID=4283 RepID=UPI0028988222|nr:uncharacterized protein LOC132282034 [Cornus florida]